MKENEHSRIDITDLDFNFRYRVTEQILKDGRGLRVKWKPHGGLPGLVAPGSVSDNQD